MFSELTENPRAAFSERKPHFHQTVQFSLCFNCKKLFHTVLSFITLLAPKGETKQTRLSLNHLSFKSKENNSKLFLWCLACDSITGLGSQRVEIIPRYHR